MAEIYREHEVRAADGAPATDEITLDLLVRGVASTDFLPRDVQHWLRHALREYVAANGEKSIDQCLGLRPQAGGRSFARRVNETQRRAAIVRAYQTIDGCGELSHWRRCDILASEIADFRKTYLPKWKKDGAPQNPSALRGALFAAFVASEAVNQAIPETAKGLHDLLTRAEALTQAA